MREGKPSNRVINVGSPMLEVINFYKYKIKKSKILKKLKLKKNNYIVLSSHREENVDDKDNFKKLINVIDLLNENYNIKVVISVHPRIKDKIKKIDKKKFKNVIFSNPFCFTDYLNLQINSKVVLSDSGTINEETSILNLKSVNLRFSHERPEAEEQGASIMTGLDLERIKQAIEYLTNNKLKRPEIVNDYNQKNVSNKLVKIIISFINFINENNYKKKY